MQGLDIPHNRILNQFSLPQFPGCRLHVAAVEGNDGKTIHAQIRTHVYTNTSTRIGVNILTPRNYTTNSKAVDITTHLRIYAFLL